MTLNKSIVHIDVFVRLVITIIPVAFYIWIHNLILMFMNNLISLFGIIRERSYNIWSDHSTSTKSAIKTPYPFSRNVYKLDMPVRIVNVFISEFHVTVVLVRISDDLWNTFLITTIQNPGRWNVKKNVNIYKFIVVWRLNKSSCVILLR